MYKYSLDKTSKKFICPRCNKKSFVKYYDNENKYYLESVYGRCDRETNCQYHNTPKNNETIINKVIILKKEVSTINFEEVSKSGRNFKNNNFIQYLKTLFNEVDIKKAILNYCIGTSNHWNSASIFWQINNHEKINTGKVILFNAENGKRVKKPYNHINWMHKVLNLKNFELQQCLFGLHLINEHKGKTIGLVESEKTAIIMSLFLPDYLWLATGSKGNFKKELLEPVKQYKILAFPDKSEFEDWNQKANELNHFGFKITCSKIIEKLNVVEGYDLADYYIDNKLCSFYENKNHTKHEINLIKLFKVNPKILNMIKKLDLVDEHFNDFKF